MPSKTPAKKPALKKAKKPALKLASAKAPAKKAKPVKKAKPTHGPQESRRGFMWKVLEQKQAEMKQKENKGPIPTDPKDRFQPTATPNGFARFNGPRRRAG